MNNDQSLFIKKGLRLISYRQRSSFELSQKLTQYADRFQLNKSSIPMAIVRLQEMGYQNDETFALWIVSSYTGKKAKGKRYIEHVLDSHHISQDIQSRALGHMNNDELETARHVITKKFPSWQHLPFPKAASHIHSYLYRRGYSSETIHQIINEYKQQNDTA